MIDNNKVRSDLCASTRTENGCCVLNEVIVHEGSGCNGCIFFIDGDN